MGGDDLREELRELHARLEEMREVNHRLQEEMRKRLAAEEALRLSEERLSLALVAADEGWWDWNTATGVVYFSPRWFTMLGYQPNELKPCYETWFSLLHPDDARASERTVEGHIRSGRREPFSLEFRMRTKSGGWKWIESRGRGVVWDDHGIAVRLAGTHTDIDLRKKAEQALRESEERFRMVADFTYDWEYWRGADGKFIYMSPSCERISGYTREEFMADPGLLERIAHPHDADMLRLHGKQQEVDRALAVDFRITAKNGSERWIGHICRPVYGNDGRFLGRRASNRDITALKKAEALREDVERITRHDLKSPLTGIINMPGHVIRAGEVNEKQRMLLEAVEDAGRQMMHIINRSLDLYKMEQGVYQLDVCEVDILPMIRAILVDLGGPARAGKISFSVWIRDKKALDEDSFTVRCEEMLFRTMIANLVKNAVEASPEGSTVRIDLEAEKPDDAGDVRIKVSNAGVVPHQIRETFFNKYTTYGKRYGTGLGTYSIRLIAETHGGRVNFVSTEAEGTTLTVTLPRNPAPLAHEEHSREQEHY